MKPFSQRDKRWVNHKIGETNSTLGRYGCTITCLAMMAELSPDITESKLDFQKDLILWQSISKEKLGLEFVWRGYIYDNQVVKETIEEFGACLVEVDWDGSSKTTGKHWVLFIGNGRMIDSYTGKECSTSKYPLLTGFAIIKAYNQPEELSMTKDESNALNIIKKYKKEAKHGNLEGAANAAVNAVSEKEELGKKVSNLNKEITTLKKLQKSFEVRLSELETKVKKNEENEQNWQKEFKTANKTISNITKDLEFFKPYKTRYEDKCKEAVANQSVGILLKQLLIKLGLWRK